jgi:hypothetical protein
MPYNPDEGNSTRWAFKCSCTYGDWVDPELPSATNGSLWMPDTLCMTRNYLGWITDITNIIHLISAVCIFVFACNTWLNLRRMSTKGCCKMKMGLELIMLMVQFALAAVCFSLYFASFFAARKDASFDFATGVLYTLLTPVSVFNFLIVAVTWTHVATNARAFRRTTPGTAKRRARVFVGIMVSVVVLGVLAQWIVDNATGALVYMFCAVVVIIVYLVGSCKLQGVIEAKMAGSTAGDGTTTTKRGSWIIKSVRAWAPSVCGKSVTSGANQRHQHLQTIMQAARSTVACCSAYVVCTLVFATQRQGVGRIIFVFLLFHTFFWQGYVLTRYYRKAIFAGALSKRKHRTTAGEESESNAGADTITNTSVVPVP